MQIEIIKKPKSTVLVKGSLPAEEFNSAIRRVTDKFVAKAELPGFRKGKAPEKMAVDKIGEATILEEAANEVLSKEYPNILKDNSINAMGQPQIRITKLARGNPLEFEAEIAIFPDIILPSYQDIAKKLNAVPQEEISVSDEELTKSLDWLRKSRRSSTEAPPTTKTGTEKDVAQETLPELTDEFAKSVGNFNTVAELTDAIRANMKLEKEEKAHDKRRMELMDAICKQSTLEVPDVLIASEKERMIAELRHGTTSMGMDWNMYLQTLKKTEDDLRKEWQTDAELRAKRMLVLQEIAKKESLAPSDEECNAWAYQYLASRPDEEKKDLDVDRVKDYAYGVIRNQKVFAFLENIK